MPLYLGLFLIYTAIYLFAQAISAFGLWQTCAAIFVLFWLLSWFVVQES